MSRHYICQFFLPWFGNHDGELYYSAMTLTDTRPIDRRRTFRIIRKWYQKEIGIQVDKQTLQRLWNRRHETTAIPEEAVAEYIQNLARQTYEETQEITDTSIQDGASKEAKLCV